MKLAFFLAAAVAVLAAVAAWHERQSDVRAWASGPAHARGTAVDDMVLVPAGDYTIGDRRQADAPVRRASVDAFLIDRHEVTNRQFAAFVAATGHVTGAERAGGAWVFRGGSREWKWTAGASWRHPLGPGSSIRDAMNHPVVMVSWHDATAYANWAGKRLPTEVEWEVAARAGTFERDRGHPAANVWEGTWPHRNSMQDGFFYTAPAGSFPANRLGLYDMIGNVWEWTADAYGRGPLRVARGGSWFCSSDACDAFRPGFRGRSPAAHAFNNVGFRCAQSTTTVLRSSK